MKLPYTAIATTAHAAKQAAAEKKKVDLAAKTLAAEQMASATKKAAEETVAAEEAFKKLAADQEAAAAEQKAAAEKKLAINLAAKKLAAEQAAAEEERIRTAAATEDERQRRLRRAAVVDAAIATERKLKEATLAALTQPQQQDEEDAVAPSWAETPVGSGIQIEADSTVAIKLDAVPRPMSVDVSRKVDPGQTKDFEFVMESPDVSDVDVQVFATATGHVQAGGLTNKSSVLRYTSNGTLLQTGSNSTKLPGFTKHDRIRLSIDRKWNVVSLFKNGATIAVIDNVPTEGELQCSATLTNKGDQIGSSTPTLPTLACARQSSLRSRAG